MTLPGGCVVNSLVTGVVNTVDNTEEVCFDSTR
jgi:hypothetical protein